MEQIIYNSLPPNGHFPLHLSSCGGGAPEQGGGERKGTLTGSSSSSGGGGGRATALGQAGPGSAGGAAAGLSGQRRRGMRALGLGTRPGDGLRRLAPLLCLSVGSRHPPFSPRASHPASPLPPSTHAFHPDPHPQTPLTAREVLRTLLRRALSILSTHTHFKNIYFISGTGWRVFGRARRSAALGPPRRGAGDWPAARVGGGGFPSSFQARELSPCLHFGEAPRMRLLPTPSPGFLFSPRSEPEASKLLVSAALLLCDCSEEKRTSVRRGRRRPAAARGGRSRVNASLIPEISGALVNESYIF